MGIACFVGSEFVNAIPNQELGHDADAVVPEAPPAEFAQGLYDAKELYKKCGSRPSCPMAHCNHMKRVCRQVNYKGNCDAKMRNYKRCKRVVLGNKSQNKSNPPPPPTPPPPPNTCGPYPKCYPPSCNYKKYECRTVNFKRNCVYKSDDSKNSACRSMAQTSCNKMRRQWQDCKRRLRGLKL